MRKIIALIVTLLTLHCSTLQPNGEPSIHATGLYHLCPVLKSTEEIRSTDDVFVLAYTQPISEMFALHLEYTSQLLTPSDAFEDEKLDNAYRQRFSSEPVPLPTVGSCSWQTTNSERSELYSTDKLILEVSGVIENPFDDNQESRGFFGRLSYGLRSGASWYWVAVEDTGFRVLALDISDG